jgi:hypothetical protein
MKVLITILVTCSIALAVEPVIEKTVDIGYDFRLITIAESSNSTFESIGHFQYLFYKDKKLSQSGTCAVSPNGKTAIYQDGPSGNIFIFCPPNKTIQMTKKSPGVVREFVWKGFSLVEVRIYDRPSTLIGIGR